MALAGLAKKALGRKARLAAQGVDDANLSKKVYARVNAMFTTWLIIAFVVPFWFLQFIFWMVSIAGLGTTMIPLIGRILPGTATFQAFSLFGGMMGILFMLTAFAIYLARGVDCWSGWKMLIFAVCFALSVAPIIFFIPWVFVWCFCVVFLQTGETEEE